MAYQNAQSNSIVNIIVNAIPPYAYEINNILSLPDGVSYRARFRRHWCPTIQDIVSLANRDGIIILRDWNTAKLIPLRHIRLLTVDLVGSIFYISYILSNLVELNEEKTIREEQIRRFNDQLKVELEPYENNGGADLMKLVFLAPDLTANFVDAEAPTDQTQRDYHNWGKIVEMIGTLDCFNDIDFLKIIGIKQDTGTFTEIKEINGLNRYILQNDQSYYLEVFQQAFTSKIGDSSVSKRDLILNFHSGALDIVQGQYSIMGRYERYAFRFNTYYNPGKIKDTDLLLDINRTDNKGPIPTISIPIRINRSPSNIIFSLTFFATFIIGSVLLFIGDKLVSSFPTIPAEFARNLGILLMILSGPSIKDLVTEFFRQNVSKPNP